MNRRDFLKNLGFTALASGLIVPVERKVSYFFQHDLNVQDIELHRYYIPLSDVLDEHRDTMIRCSKEHFDEYIRHHRFHGRFLVRLQRSCTQNDLEHRVIWNGNPPFERNIITNWHSAKRITVDEKNNLKEIFGPKYEHLLCG